jgi:hypothetical protein
MIIESRRELRVSQKIKRNVTGAVPRSDLSMLGIELEDNFDWQNLKGMYLPLTGTARSFYINVDRVSAQICPYA